MLATFVAVTRIYDYKHAPADVNAGCFIGIFSGLFAYLLNFPSILSLSSPLPKTRTFTTQGLNAIVPSQKANSPSALEQKVSKEEEDVFRANSTPYPV